MNLVEERLQLPFTAITALIAGCAALGITFMLVLSAPPSPDPWLTVPGLGILFALFLVSTADRSARRARQEAESQAFSDPSSGLLPAHLGRRFLQVAFAAAQRGQPLTIVLFSIDGLTRYRALNGHPAATRVMRIAGRVLNSQTRGMHLSTRHNGDAVFLSILSGVPIEGACTFAVRVRKEFGKQVATGEPRVLSSGIVTFDPSVRSADKLLERGQRALAKAVSDGGKVVMVDPTAGGEAREKTALDRKALKTAVLSEEPAAAAPSWVG
jgi:diguanylate cyclase (GGDEF)-like protein